LRWWEAQIQTSIVLPENRNPCYLQTWPDFKPRQIYFLSSAIGRRKNLEKLKSTPRYLQPLEIPQNRQRNVWKNLEKKGLDLEMLGEKAWRFGAPHPLD
jgi:hypothetical protein